MRDALSSLDQLISFKGDKVREEDALGVFGLVSRSALESLAGAILKGDVGAILEQIDMFYSAGKNMRRLSAELLTHFRNLVAVQALGPESKTLAVTPDQAKSLAEQAKGVDPSRVFRICDILADMEDKLRYVLSARTLIEMSLIRASRVATTASIEELMKAVRELKAGIGGGGAPAGAAAVVERRWSEGERRETGDERRAEKSAAPAPQSPAAPAPQPISRSAILDDPKLNSVLSSLPGAIVTDIKEKRK